MKKLKEVKHEIFKSYGYNNENDFFDKALNTYDPRTPEIIDAIADKWATEALKELGEYIRDEFKEPDNKQND